MNFLFNWTSRILVSTALLSCPAVLGQQTSKIILRERVMSSASLRYDNPSVFKKILFGKNYRKEWSTPVSLPVFDLKNSGLTITGMGGGMQTKSLRLKDKNGDQWVLRTVDKDVTSAVPNAIRNRFTVSIVQEMVSAAHPYAPLAIPTLAQAAGAKVIAPKYFWIPDDTSFGEYRKFFGNTLCMLERRTFVSEKIGVEDTKNTVDSLLSSHRYSLDQEMYLKARLLDMLIADWDRHQDQWKWLEYRSGERVNYVALPIDRDQAFFFSQGLLIKMAKLKLKHLVGFTATTEKLKNLNLKSWNMDRLFLNSLSESDWKRIIQKFQSDLQEETITMAVNKLPGPVYDLSGKTIRDKLIHRRNGLLLNAIDYYRFLARQVIVNGTDDAEIYQFYGNKDSLTIEIYDVKEKTKPLYKRTFYAHETSEIRVFALGGNDSFIGNKIAETGINIIVDDGKGNDQHDSDCSKYCTIENSEMDAEAYKNVVYKQLRIKD